MTHLSRHGGDRRATKTSNPLHVSFNDLAGSRKKNIGATIFQKESGVNNTKKGFDLFLIHVDMAIKASLRAHNKFHVTSTAEFLRKLRILFH